MKVRPTMTPKEEATWMQRIAPPTPTACPVRRVHLKPRHWTESLTGWCQRCRDRRPLTAKHTEDHLRHEVKVTCDRCGGVVTRHSSMLGNRRKP